MKRRKHQRKELQTTNEELEAANEEMQATNEELISVNEELNVKTGELAKLYKSIPIFMTR